MAWGDLALGVFLEAGPGSGFDEAVEGFLGGEGLVGEIKPRAKRAILACLGMAKELMDPADIARCHAVGQACSTVYTEGHAMGYPIYELTALVRELGVEDCREAVEARVRIYEQRLRLWTDPEKTSRQDWAAFLRE